jgi:hypothetical protein
MPAMETNMLLSAVISLGTLFIVMYIVLKKYTFPAVKEPFFSDPTFFKLMTLGLVAGTGILVGYTFFGPTGGWSSIFIALAFAVLFEIVKLVFLNLKRFHGKSDTLFYGFGLGIGMGGAFSFGFLFYASSGVSPVVGDDLTVWIFFAIIALQTILLHSALGMTIGEGVARYRPFEFFTQALIISVSYQLLMSQVWAGHSETMTYAFLIIAFLLSFGYFYKTIYDKLPKNIKEVLREKGKTKKDE